jgi:chorismate mutase/prephenate dehydratase
MSNEEEQLRAIRNDIDDIDRQIQSLISRRARCAQRVAEVKLSHDPEAVFYRPEREAQVLREIMARDEGPLPKAAMATLFREIMSACLALEKPMQIAYLGPEGTFTQAAVQKHFGHGAVQMPMGAIDEVFREVESGQAEYGVVPVENSTEGVVNHTLDMFLRSPLKISGEVIVRIHHNLLGDAESLDGIQQVFAHPQALAQCRNWLDRNLPHAQRVATSSNAEAARQVKGRPEVAAIAGSAAAEIYRLNTLVRNIEDEPENSTRFLVIGHNEVPASGVDKTTLLISAPNKPGSLYKMLVPLSENGLSMTRIESRPSRGGLWEYVFFIDIDGHKDSPAVADALAQLRQEAALYRVLGAYPKAVY